MRSRTSSRTTPGVLWPVTQTPHPGSSSDTTPSVGESKRAFANFGIDQIAARMRRLARNHRRVRRAARHDHVHGDPGSAELAGMARGHRLEAGFGRPAGLPAEGERPGEARRHVDDPAVTLLDHARQRVVAQVPRTAEVDPHEPIPHLRAELPRPHRSRQVARTHRIQADSRVVDERVHGAETVGRRLDAARAGSRVGDVGLDRHQPLPGQAVPGEPGGEACERLPADVGRRRPRAFAREGPHEPRSDAAGRTGDDRDPAVQPARHLNPSASFAGRHVQPVSAGGSRRARFRRRTRRLR